MNLPPCFDLGFSPRQLQNFKRQVSATCRNMTANQILDLADYLHNIIRERSSAAGSLNIAVSNSLASVADQAWAP